MDTFPVLGKAYRPRVIDSVVVEALDTAGAVLIEGARACGKTMTGLHAASSYVFLDEPEAEQMLSVAPRSLLEGDPPRLLDEWQLAPTLWNLVRRQVDASDTTGLFLLTGSAVPDDDVARHTGAGRVLRLRMRTMSWWEKNGCPAGGVSLADLFDGHQPTPDKDTDELDSVISMLLRPGFPAMAGLSEQRAQTLLRAYADEVSRTDVRRIADVRHDPAVVARLITAVARASSTDASTSTLASDVRVLAPSITDDTISSYLKLLQRLFVVEAQEAWAPRLRSRARLRTSAKLHLADPALAAAVLRAGPQRLSQDLNTLGLLFESAITHDLSVLAGPLGGEVLHHRDSNGYEIDAVITLPDGRWGAVEVKLGGIQIEAGARSLTRAVAQIDTSTVGDPVFRLVITGTGPTLTLDDGTITCPLARLAP